MSARPPRRVVMVTHTGRAEANAAACALARRLAAAGLSVLVPAAEADELACPDVEVLAGPDAAADAELLVAVGGDGTLLRAAELARPAGLPLLGINLGHVGFLAEAERSDLESTVERIRARAYDIEERLTLEVVILRDGRAVQQDWALNDVTVEKSSRQRMLDLVVEIDGRPLSRWGGDGVVCATPTGSTAYAFSAGGPVVWPSVQALLVVPISAHALFARPLVVAPDSCIAVEILPERGNAVVFCDGRRTRDAGPADRIEIRRGHQPVRLVRLQVAPFADRLVDKFQLPVRGWRGPPDGD